MKLTFFKRVHSLKMWAFKEMRSFKMWSEFSVVMFSYTCHLLNKHCKGCVLEMGKMHGNYSGFGTYNITKLAVSLFCLYKKKRLKRLGYSNYWLEYVFYPMWQLEWLDVRIFPDNYIFGFLSACQKDLSMTFNYQLF